VPAARAEEARASMIELFPEGFEEVELADGLELVAYTDARGEERLWQAFGGGAKAAEVQPGWEERWRSFHRGAQAGPLWVGPPWERAPRGLLAVVIDPGAAFGTGAHPTTRLAVELLATVPRGSLLDVGCGSGVVAVAGARLGFAPVTAVDVESQAVSETERNAAANRVRVDARCADALAVELPSVDVAVANITLAVVEALALRVEAGWLVTSGYLVSDNPALPGWEHVDRRQQDGWAADAHRRVVRGSARPVRR
jgi:ribosomal protein L11 methyltransferase